MSTENEDGFPLSAPRGPEGAGPGRPEDDRTAQQPPVPGPSMPPPPAVPSSAPSPTPGYPQQAVPPAEPAMPPTPPAPSASAQPGGGPDPHAPFGPPASQQPPVFGAPPPPWGATDGPPLPPPGPLPASPQEQPGRGKVRGGLVALIAAAVLAAGAAGGGVGYVVSDHSGSGVGSTTVSSPADQAALNRKPGSVAGIAAKALPSTVTIQAESGRESDTGAGFVYDKEGHILTNNHVVAPAADGGTLTVTFSNGKSYKASVVGNASGYDVAVIKLDNPGDANLTPLPLGNSNEVAVGDATVAIGAPYGLSGTVTTGIISALNRPVASGDSTGSQVSYMSAIQTDASINPGNSGGPLLDGSGRVIGINSAIRSGDDYSSQSNSGSVGLGFAIPINQANRVAQDLISTGEPVYAVMGVLRNDDYQGKGAQISTSSIQGTEAVTSGGPADKAGLKPGDVITKLDDALIDSGPTLVGEIWTHQPGEPLG